MDEYWKPTGSWTPISTKLHRPSVAAHFIARPRLVELLNQGLACSMTLVCAGAGYGKTTLVSAWLADMAAGRNAATPRPTAWLSLDQYDSDLATLVRYCCAALRTIFPEACPQTLALVAAPQPAPLTAVVATLSNEIEALPEDFILVLDDFQAIDSVEIVDLFAGLARHWPQHFHLVMISRRSPLLPLASLRAKRWLVEIRTRDLQLTVPEMAEYVTSVVGQRPSDAVLAKLERYTEGWFIGLNLAALSLAGDIDAARLDALLESDADVADYLMAELLAHQAPDVMAFLLKTSLFNRFSVGLCEHAFCEHTPSGESDGADCSREVRRYLDWLESVNFLIVPLDDHREWYRYHHLVQELLRSRAAVELGTEQAAALRRRAASWFAAQGLLDDALQHAIMAQDVDLAAGFLEQGLCDLLNNDDRPTLRRWMGLVPEDLRSRRPGLVLNEAWLAHFSWQLPKMSRALDRLETLIASEAEALAAHELRILRGNILGLRGQEAWFRNQPDRALACMQQALAILPERWSYVRGGCMMYLGLSSRDLGQGDAVNQLLWARYEAAPDKSDPYAVRILMALCFNTFMAGRLEHTRQTAALMLVQARHGNRALVVGWAHYLLGMVHYEWGEMDAARNHFQAIAHERYSVHTLTARQGMFGLLRVQYISGDMVGAEETLEDIRQYDLGLLGYETAETQSVRAWLQYRRGHATEALRWATAFTAPVPDQPLYWLQNAHFAKAHLLVAGGGAADSQVAALIIDALYEVAQRTHNTYAQARLLALRGLALHKSGQDRGSLAALRQALTLAEPGGFVRIFADLGASMQALLGQIEVQRSTAELVSRILAASPAPGLDTAPRVLPAPNSPLVEPLTPRELEILRLLRLRWSNKEIASQLGITLDTTERHLANLYGKLDVHTRGGAVAKAGELGIPLQP